MQGITNNCEPGFTPPLPPPVSAVDNTFVPLCAVTSDAVAPLLLLLLFISLNGCGWPSRQITQALSVSSSGTAEQESWNWTPMPKAGTAAAA